jgi:hypothetical protein
MLGTRVKRARSERGREAVGPGRQSEVSDAAASSGKKAARAGAKESASSPEATMAPGGAEQRSTTGGESGPKALARDQSRSATGSEGAHEKL